MRKLLIGAVAAAYVGAGGTALANGSIKDVVVVEPVPVWTGCYVGLGVGGAWSDDNSFGDLHKPKHEYGNDYEKKGDYKREQAYADYKKDKKDNGDYWVPVDKKYFDFDDHTDSSTIFGGILAGCNWERSNFVYGVEGDIGFGNDIDYLASLRGRIGVAWDRSLIYVTAGVAFVGLDRDFNLWHKTSSSYLGYSGYPDGGYYKEFDHRFNETSDETGWVIGAGYEKLIGTNATIGIEGLYYMFDDDDSTHEWLAEDDHYYHPRKFDRDVDNDIFVLRARLTYLLRRAPEPLK